MEGERGDILMEPVEEEEIATKIAEEASRGVVSWKRMLEMGREVGISSNRLRKIVLGLVSGGTLVELKCRLFTSKAFLESVDARTLAELIKTEVRRAGIRKCGKPLTPPKKGVRVVIAKTGAVRVCDSRHGAGDGFCSSL